MSDSLQPHGLYHPWNSLGYTGVDSLSLLQGIFPTQGSNPGLPLCRQILYQLSYKGIPRILEWVAFSRGYSWPRNRIGVFCIAGGFFTNWAIKRAHNRYKVNSSSWVLRLCTAFIFFLLFWTKFSVLRFYRKKGEFLKKHPWIWHQKHKWENNWVRLTSSKFKTFSFKKKKCKLLSLVRLFVTPWTAAHQPPLSMEFFRKEYCSG